jgi:hypothetical protein
MPCVLAEAERIYGAFGIPFFTLECALVDGKKTCAFPRGWQRDARGQKARNKNAVCVRTGFAADAAFSLVVVDADGVDACATFESLARRAGVDLARVPQVQTQRGASGRHFYFRAVAGTLAAALRSTAKIAVDGAQTSIDIRAGANGEGVGCVLAPPTVVTGGGTYTLLPGPAVHEAPAMPDSLATLLCSRARPAAAVGANATVAAVAAAAVGTVGAVGASEPLAALEPLCAAALRDAKARAGTESVGYPTRAVTDGASVRVEFTHRGTRTCPVSRNEHRSNHFNVVARADERTGLPAFFVYCHSAKEGCKGAGHRMLCVLDADEAREFLDGPSAPTPGPLAQPTLAQAAVAVGEAQKALDRLLENPNGEWATVESLSVIACALCTAAGGFPGLADTARLMLDGLLEATQLTDAERALAKRAFQQAKTPLDPVATLRGFAAGLNGKREQELMIVREAIVACTDPSLEADVPNAAESMMCVLEFCERRDSYGKVHSLGNISELGMFIFHIWRRVARYGFDRTQSSAAHQWTFYLFNGATYERGQWEQLAIRGKKHVYAVIKHLCDAPSLKSRAESAFARCQTSDFISRALADTQMSFKDVEQLKSCGIVSPDKFERELDMGNYIGFTNGVYDILNDRFMGQGSVPLNVLVSMCTNYDYVHPDDPRFPENRTQIEEFYRTLHAENYEDRNDERLAAMWLLSGSLLFRGNVCKKAYIFLGSEGDNGKSTFTELIQLTLGDYAVTGSRSSLSGPSDHATLDPDLVANHKSLVCTFPEVQSVENGLSAGFKFNCGKLKALTGQDEQSARGLYRDKKGIVIRFKPIMHSNFMPQVDSDDSAARNRLWVARFGSTFPAGLTEKDIPRRRFPRIENLRDQMAAWAPFHFLLMLEALRDFRRRNCVLPPGAQQIEGSLMHQALVAQTPEGKLRAWVEEHYSHVPLREKDSGTKLEALYTAYATTVPSVHAKVLGKILFGKMLNAIFPNIGPHKNTTSTAFVYLLR